MTLLKSVTCHIQLDVAAVLNALLKYVLLAIIT